MKRGLKVRNHVGFIDDILSYNRCPDEKGTESSLNCRSRVRAHVTTVTPMKRGLKGSENVAVSFLRDWRRQGYNRYPDEKGTESCNGRSDLRIATRYSKPFMVDFRIT